ncbi:M56 family metallopeptidase [Bacillus chungangensis]|uniref:Beta-lactamase regulating signal transducer with metallopeptidase domain/ribosome maturation factor RimP n=1 Tax=Bacillus chungangensis TaxID=587633 RepID=A0ABT9WTB1_9BACI|nr:M56 family metallopeptidase [Bacillus chungangensis]MDQ0176465.1 beta-lactamase regulating signal transducer with metallopeptidase domain/ribosome maturation factor RimP [Bacillus chungangensis]
MMSFFLSLLITSFVGTIIWVLQNCIKPVTQKVFSPTWHYYSGLIPVFFLLGGSAAIINGLVPFIRSIIPVPDTDTNLTAETMTETMTESITETMTEPLERVMPIEQTASHFSFLDRMMSGPLWHENIKEMIFFAILVWAVGTILFLAVQIKRYLAFKRSILQNSRVCETVKCPVKVIISARATTPMLMGLWKPIVIMPDIQLGDKELAMILSHELVHLKRGDLLVKLIVLVANAVHWFNPAAYSLNKQLDMLCELSCDEKVVQNMDTESRRLYGETILSMLEYGVKQRNVVCTSSFNNSKKYIKRRLNNLMIAKKPKKSMIVLSAVAAISLIGSGGAATYAATSIVPSEKALSNQAESLSNQAESLSNQAEKLRKSYELTAYELTEKVRPYLDKDLPVPQEYLNAINTLPLLNSLNDLYGYVSSKEGLSNKEETLKKINELREKVSPYLNNGLSVPQEYRDAFEELDDTITNYALLTSLNDLYTNVSSKEELANKEETLKKINELKEKVNPYLNKGLPVPREYRDAIHSLVQQSKGARGDGYIQHSDGTVEHVDKEGNRTPLPPMKNHFDPKFDEETQKKYDELNKKMNAYINLGIPAPEDYINAINALHLFHTINDHYAYISSKEGLSNKEETLKKINELSEKVSPYLNNGLPVPQKYRDAIQALDYLKAFNDHYAYVSSKEWLSNKEETLKKINELSEKISPYLNNGLPVPEEFANEYHPLHLLRTINNHYAYVSSKEGSSNKEEILKKINELSKKVSPYLNNGLPVPEEYSIEINKMEDYIIETYGIEDYTIAERKR